MRIGMMMMMTKDKVNYFVPTHGSYIHTCIIRDIKFAKHYNLPYYGYTDL